MRILVLFLCLLFLRGCEGYSQTINVVDGDTFVIRQKKVPAGCHGLDSLPTCQVWYGDQKLDLNTGKCWPECVIDDVVISYVDDGEHKHMLLIESVSSKRKYASYFIRTDPCTYAKIR